MVNSDLERFYNTTQIATIIMPTSGYMSSNTVMLPVPFISVKLMNVDLLGIGSQDVSKFQVNKLEAGFYVTVTDSTYIPTVSGKVILLTFTIARD